MCPSSPTYIYAKSHMKTYYYVYDAHLSGSSKFLPTYPAETCSKHIGCIDTINRTDF